MDEDDRSIFVGRQNEEKQFKLLVSGQRGGIVVVEGRVGVGKTSFVNAMQYDKWKSKDQSGAKMLPSFETIESKENVESTDFMLSVLSNFIYTLEKIHGPSKIERDKTLQRGKELIAKTLRSGYGFNFSALGVGVGGSKEIVPNQPSITVLPSVMHTIDECLEKASKDYAYQAFIIPINNLDVLSDEAVTGFLNSARDTLLSRTRVWWILTSKPGFTTYLEIHARRVSEMLTGRPVRLDPLSLSDLREAIKIRLRKFAKPGTKPVSPISDLIIDHLYKVSNGEIRYVFKRLSDPRVSVPTGLSERKADAGKSRF